MCETTRHILLNKYDYECTIGLYKTRKGPMCATANIVAVTTVAGTTLYQSLHANFYV